MYEVLLSATALLCLAAILIGGRYYRDTFHPLVYLGALLGTLYVGYPAYLLWEGDIGVYLSDTSLVEIQSICLIGVAAMLVGVWRGAGPRISSKQVASVDSEEDHQRVRIAAIVLGLAGVAGFAYGLVGAGGIGAAYGQGYGGGWSDSGYLRETFLFTLPALLWLMASYQVERPGWLIWGLILVIASPLLMQGLLGGRRGPTFMAVVGLVVGWCIMRRTRPHLVTVLIGGGLVGGLLLFLVANRDQIYLGSDFQFQGESLSTLRAAAGNEYIYGGALILHAQENGEFYWGGRYVQLFLVRPIPKEWWPAKYDDSSQFLGVPGVDRGNAGLASTDLISTVGWVGAVGAAPGIVADLWVEFWWLGIAGLFGIGWIYGRAWRKGITQGGAWVPCFGILTALSIYLVAQDLEAMGFRALFMLGGSVAIWYVGKRDGHPSQGRQNVLSMGAK